VDIYLAAPLFSEAERRFNEDICGQIEEAGYSVFLPQRDGIESTNALLARDDIDGREDAMNDIFDVDRSEVIESDVVIAVLDGPMTDPGVAVEVGIAHEHRIPAIGLDTDPRGFSEDEPINSMVFGCLCNVIEAPSELVAAVRTIAEDS